MRKRWLTLAALALAMLLPALGLAEAVVTDQRAVEGFAAMHPVNGTYVLRLTGDEANKYAVFRGGERLSAAYDQIDARQDIPYYYMRSGSGVNAQGLIDGNGAEVLPPAYGRIDVIGDRWLVACTLAEDWYTVFSADVYFDGVKIGTLGPEEYKNGTYASAHGAYLGVCDNEKAYYLDSGFRRVESPLNYLPQEEYWTDWSNGNVYHLGSGQQAFTASCTLTPGQVERALWYDRASGCFLDLQGNVAADWSSPNGEYLDIEYSGGDYLKLRTNDGTGVMDMRGRVLLEPVYSALGGDTRSCFAMGYQAVIRDGVLSWLDRDGHTTATVPDMAKEDKYQGFGVNGLFVVIDMLGDQAVYTASAGPLPECFDGAVAVSSPWQRILTVKLDGLWGAIDMEGNEVIPFVHTGPLSISQDGTLAVGQTARGEQMVYTLSFDDAPAVEHPTRQPATDAPATELPTPTPLDDGPDGWVCPVCQRENLLNFCPYDGTARPEPSCPSCGYELPRGNDYLFCPACGEALGH